MLSTRHLLTLPLSLALLLHSGAASAVERRYSISDFERIRVVGASRVIVEVGRATTISAVGERDAIEGLLVEVIDRTLTIQPVAGRVASAALRPLKPATLYITAPVIRSVRLSGAGAIMLAVLRGLQADVSLTGSGQISVKQVMVDNLTARLAGSGTLTLAGKALTVDADIKGAGNVAAGSLDAADLKLTIASSGTSALSARRAAAITSTGSGTVTIVGSPSCTVQNIGVGSVICGK
jgi:hypothetical protein